MDLRVLKMMLIMSVMRGDTCVHYVIMAEGRGRGK